MSSKICEHSEEKLTRRTRVARLDVTTVLYRRTLTESRQACSVAVNVGAAPRLTQQLTTMHFYARMSTLMLVTSLMCDVAVTLVLLCDDVTDDGRCLELKSQQAQHKGRCDTVSAVDLV